MRASQKDEIDLSKLPALTVLSFQDNGETRYAFCIEGEAEKEYRIYYSEGEGDEVSIVCDDIQEKDFFGFGVSIVALDLHKVLQDYLDYSEVCTYAFLAQKIEAREVLEEEIQEFVVACIYEILTDGDISKNADELKQEIEKYNAHAINAKQLTFENVGYDLASALIETVFTGCDLGGDFNKLFSNEVLCRAQEVSKKTRDERDNIMQSYYDAKQGCFTDDTVEQARQQLEVANLGQVHDSVNQQSFAGQTEAKVSGQIKLA